MRAFNLMELIAVIAIFTSPLQSSTVFAAEKANGKILLNESFSSGAIPAEWKFSKAGGKVDWKVENNELRRTRANGGGLVTFGKDDWPVGSVELKFKPLDYVAGKDNFVYLNYRGASIRFCPKNGMLHWIDFELYKKNKKNGQLRVKTELEQGWQTLKVEFSNNAPSIYINGKYIVTCKNLSQASGKIKFGCWMMRVAIKNIKVTATTTGDTGSYNYLGNSSFEHATNPDVPDFWFETDHAFGINAESVTEKDWRDFHNKWRIDKTTAYDGKQCFSLKKPYILISSPAPVTKGKAVTASVYMKAEQPGTKVKIGLGRGSGHARGYSHKIIEKTVTITTKWQRLSIQLPDCQASMVNFFIVPVSDSRIWVDAAQMESGTKPTTYVTSPVDKQYKQPFFAGVSNSKPKSSDIPQYTVKAGKPEKLDGSLSDKAWQNTASVEMKEFQGAAPLQKTIVKFMRDGENLYVGIDCRDTDIDHLVTGTLNKGMDTKVWGKDAVEIFIDPDGDGQTFYQLAFSAEGNRWDMMKIDQDGAKTSWNGNWQVFCRKNRDGWSAEAVIPFQMMQVDPDYKRFIRVNVCRNYPRGPQQLFAWSPVEVSFHEPREFGKLLLNKKGSAVSFDILDSQLFCKNPVDNDYEWRIKLINNSSQKQLIKTALTIYRKSGKNNQFNKTITIMPGKTAQLALNIPAVSEGELKGSIIISDQKKSFIYKKERKTLPVPKPIDAFFEYTYYTSEQVACLVIESTIPTADNLKIILFDKNNNLISTQKQKTKHQGDYDFVTVSLKKLSSAGSPYQVSVEALNSKGKILAKVKTKLLVLSKAVTEVKTNRINRGIYVNGKPFIPYITLQSLPKDPKKYAAQISFLKKSGMSALSTMSQWYSQLANEVYLKEAEKQNMPVIMFCMMEPHRTYNKKERLALFKNSPSIIGICVADEVTNAPDWSFATVRKAEAFNPHILNFASHNMGSLALSESHKDGTSGDLYSIDRYPVMPKRTNYRATKEMYTLEIAMKKLTKAAEKKRLPMNAWVQGGFSFIREPTIAEVEWMIYLPLVMGSRGFMYYANVPRSKILWRKMGAIGREIKTLTPILFSLEAKSKIKPGNQQTAESIRFITRQHKGKIYIIAVNRLMKNINVAFDLSQIKETSKKVKVMFEERALKLNSNATFTDKFAPLSRHVYCLEK